MAAPVPHTPDKPKPNYDRLTQAEVGVLWNMHQAGQSQIDIAETLGCNVASVCRWLQKLEPTEVLATQIMRSSAIKVARNLVKTKHAPTQLEILRDLKVTTKHAPEGETRPGVTVLIGLRQDMVIQGVDE